MPTDNGAQWPSYELPQNEREAIIREAAKRAAEDLCAAFLKLLKQYAADREATR